MATKNSPKSGKFIRLSHPRLGTIQALSETILMAMADEHKIKVLVLTGKDHNWFERSGSLKKFAALLDKEKFEQVNKFYILNWQRVLGYNSKTQTVFFKTNFSVELKHKIKASILKARSF